MFKKSRLAATILARIVIILLLYDDDIVLMERCPSNLDKQLRIHNFCSNIGMTVNTDKTKIMIIKPKKDTYANFIYDNKNLEEVTSYKYLEIDIYHKLN